MTLAAVQAALARDGWAVLREGGRHTIYRHPTKPGLVPVPRHRQLSSGVVRDIIRRMGLTVDEFRALL
jgi:predicted RNA binding protein YcfA (HicA-like mRNA interferase family)